VQKLSLNFINKVLIKNNLSVNQNILGTAFKKDIGIAKEWLQKNKNLFSGVIQLPLYLTMEAKKREKIEYFSMKKMLTQITQAEFDEMAQALSFKFDKKEDFILFNNAMLNVLLFIYLNFI